MPFFGNPDPNSYVIIAKAVKVFVEEPEPEPEEEIEYVEEYETSTEETESNGFDYGDGRTDTPWMYYHSTFELIGMWPQPVFFENTLNSWPDVSPSCRFSFGVDFDDEYYGVGGGLTLG